MWLVVTTLVSTVIKVESITFWLPLGSTPCFFTMILTGVALCCLAGKMRLNREWQGTNILKHTPNYSLCVNPVLYGVVPVIMGCHVCN